MRHINKLWVRVLIAVVIGFFLAGAGTKNTYECAYFAEEPNAGCISIEKVVMHPADLFANKQNSLMRFSTIFIVSSLISFTLLSLISFLRRKKSMDTGQNKPLDANPQP